MAPLVPTNKVIWLIEPMNIQRVDASEATRHQKPHPGGRRNRGWRRLSGVATSFLVLLLFSSSAFSQDTKDAALKARTMISAGDLSGARAFLKNELKKRPNSGQLLHAYADVLSSQGDEVLSQAARLKACAYNSKEACRLLRPDPLPSATIEAPTSVASRCLAEGINLFFDRPAAAVTQFRCAVEASPTSGYAHGALGLALAKSGSASEAAVAFQTACSLGHTPSCQRRAILAAFADENVKDDTHQSRQPEFTHTVVLKDDRTYSGKLVKDTDEMVLLLTPHGTKEIPRSEVREIFALVSEQEAQWDTVAWKQWTVEVGTSMGYSFTSSRFEPDSDKGTEAFQFNLIPESHHLHTISGKLSAGIFLFDTLELELFARTLVALTDNADEVFLQAGISALYHVPFQSNRLFFGPTIGTEATVDEISPDGDDPLTTTAGLMAGGVFGLKIPVGRAAAIEAAITLAYAYATGTRETGASESEHRFRTLLEVGILWYP